jgi:hypothetical protein
LEQDGKIQQQDGTKLEQLEGKQEAAKEKTKGISKIKTN